jgi:DNA polymerase III alpha subunit
MGIEILPPDIETSMPFFTVEEEGVRFGLAAL